MCVPGCQEALHAALSRRGFFTGAAAAGFAATAVLPAEAAKKKAPAAEAKKATAADAKKTVTASEGIKAPTGQSYFKGVVDLTHTMSPEFPTFFGMRIAEAVRFQKRWLQSELVEAA
jgi:secreted PhoX family phosphatase